MFDSPEEISKKIMRATTDSDNTIKYDEENKPGISNLLNIASLISGKTVKELEEQFAGKGYGEFKKFVADITSNHIRQIQERYNQILNSDEFNEILDNGISKSRELAKEKYEFMKIKMGLSRKDLSQSS